MVAMSVVEIRKIVLRSPMRGRRTYYMIIKDGKRIDSALTMRRARQIAKRLHIAPAALPGG